MRDRPRLGSNQDVFYFQVTEPDSFGLFLMRLTFYGGVRVYLAFAPEGTQAPAPLATELMARGINTIFTLGNKCFEFNPKGKP